jgi:predicted PurR-regulated permease PerM
MVVLSIIPFTGAWFIMVPAGIIQIVMGNTFQGVSIIVICVAVVSTIDNLLRPRLVGTEAKLHDLLIFFSTLGGISVFGVLGFIVGPAIAALFVTVLEIYALEFKHQLSATANVPSQHS